MMTDNENVMAVKSCKSIEDELSLIDRLKGERDCYKNELKYANNEKEALNKLCVEQKAEIEKLTKIIEEQHEGSLIAMEVYKNEAINEFWEKAKQTREFRTQPYVYIVDGDNLVKEMVGDAE